MNDENCDFIDDPELLKIDTYAEIIGTANNLLSAVQTLSDSSLALDLDNAECIRRFQSGLDALTEGMVHFADAFQMYARAHGHSLDRHTKFTAL